MIIFFMRHFALHINVTDEDQATKCEQLFLATAELGVLHEALHNTDKSFGITEVCIGNLIKNNSVACADLADLSCIEVDEKLRRGGFSSGKDVGIVRGIPVKVGFARFTWRKLNHVVVVFNQWNTAAEVKKFLAAIHLRRVEAAGIDQ